MDNCSEGSIIILLLISIIILILLNQLHTMETDTITEDKIQETNPNGTNKTVIEEKKKIQQKEQKASTTNNFTKANPIESPLLNNIDFIGKSDPLIYTKPSLEIDQIMDENSKINNVGQNKYLIEKKEDWKVDYAIGLEDGAIESLKNDRTIRPEMINGKVGFSKSF